MFYLNVHSLLFPPPPSGMFSALFLPCSSLILLCFDPIFFIFLLVLYSDAVTTLSIKELYLSVIKWPDILGSWENHPTWVGFGLYGQWLFGQRRVIYTNIDMISLRIERMLTVHSGYGHICSGPLVAIAMPATAGTDK